MGLKYVISLCALLTLVSCAPAGPVGGAKNQDELYVELEGTLRSGREIQLLDVQVLSGRSVLASSLCVSGIPRDGRTDYSNLDGSRVVARGRLYDYGQWVSRDPFGVTVDVLQNECGNSHVMVIDSVGKLRTQ